jgi:hypothetical protein
VTEASSRPVSDGFHSVSYFRVAAGYASVENCRHWVAIDVAFDRVAHPVAFVFGEGLDGIARMTSAQDAISPLWRWELEVTDATWLLPHLRAMLNGQPLNREAVLRAAEEKRGVRCTELKYQCAIP